MAHYSSTTTARKLHAHGSLQDRCNFLADCRPSHQRPTALVSTRAPAGDTCRRRRPHTSSCSLCLGRSGVSSCAAPTRLVRRRERTRASSADSELTRSSSRRDRDAARAAIAGARTPLGGVASEVAAVARAPQCRRLLWDDGGRFESADEPAAAPAAAEEEDEDDAEWTGAGRDQPIDGRQQPGGGQRGRRHDRRVGCGGGSALGQIGSGRPSGRGVSTADE